MAFTHNRQVSKQGFQWNLDLKVGVVILEGHK